MQNRFVSTKKPPSCVFFNVNCSVARSRQSDSNRMTPKIFMLMVSTYGGSYQSISPILRCFSGRKNAKYKINKIGRLNINYTPNTAE